MHCVSALDFAAARRLPRKPATGRTIRLRAVERLAREIARRRDAGAFTSRDLARLLSDSDDQARKDLTSITGRRDDLGWDRLLVIAEALDVDALTLFAPPVIGGTEL